ncbi:hypothetical protein N2152v2_007700 [Parachlorella kessleri]
MAVQTSSDETRAIFAAFIAQLYGKELTASEPTRLFLLSKVHTPALGPELGPSQFTIKAARPFSPSPPLTEVGREGPTTTLAGLTAQKPGQQPLGREARSLIEDRMLMGAEEPVVSGSCASGMGARTPPSPVHTWAELGIATLEESVPSETPLHRLASFLTGKGSAPRHSDGEHGVGVLSS